MQKKKGISLITLVITIIVMIILAATVVLNMSNTNVVTKSNEAVNKYNESQEEILNSIEYVEEKAEEIIAGRKEEVLYTGEIVGQDGELILPITLNDTSKQYILDISSTLYTGRVLVNVYSLYNENSSGFVGAVVVGEDGSYSAELRYILAAENESELAEEFWSKMNLLYIDEANEGVLLYEPEAFGSEITVTKIASVNRRYTMLAKILSNLMKNGIVTSNDMKTAMKYCINTGLLGYNYLDQLMDGSAEACGFENFNEELEMKTLKSVITREQQLKDYEYAVTAQLLYAVSMWNNVFEIQSYDMYTYINFIAENEYLNEFGYRMIGNTIVPFTVLFADDILVDLNEDGMLKTTYGDSAMGSRKHQYVGMFPSGIAGISNRQYADLWAILYPLMERYGEDMSTMSAMEQLKVEEMAMVSGITSNSTKIITIPGYFWIYPNGVYNSTEMDTMYKMMYDNGITINSAGLKMGWNSIIAEYFRYEGFSMLPQYDIKEDTDAIHRQGVSGIINEISTYITAAQEAIANETSIQEQ